MPRRSKPSEFSHLSRTDRARMVDVGDKPITDRSATAEAIVKISPALARAIRANSLAKGSVFDIARLAGIQAAKRTDELIPLCHSLPLDSVEVDIALRAGRVHITATARTHSRTGVEMEAFTAAAVVALTVIDMGKSIDRSITIERIRLLEKRGGRSGHYTASASRRRGRP